MCVYVHIYFSPQPYINTATSNSNQHHRVLQFLCSTHVSYFFHIRTLTPKINLGTHLLYPTLKQYKLFQNYKTNIATNNEPSK